MEKIVRKRGFTLIELLVVIAIIGILATIAVVSYTNAVAKSRDAKRMTDVQSIASALEMYYSEHKSYVNDSANTDCYKSQSDSGKVISADSSKDSEWSCLNNAYSGYISSMPKDPKNGEFADEAKGVKYQYFVNATKPDGSGRKNSYCVFAEALETDTGNGADLFAGSDPTGINGYNGCNTYEAGVIAGTYSDNRVFGVQRKWQ